MVDVSLQGKSAFWSHLLAFQLECEDSEELNYSQDTNSLSPSTGNNIYKGLFTCIYFTFSMVYGEETICMLLHVFLRYKVPSDNP